MAFLELLPQLPARMALFAYLVAVRARRTVPKFDLHVALLGEYAWWTNFEEITE